MAILEFRDATGVATRLDALGGIYNDTLGKGQLRFTDTQVSFNDVELPYRTIETPTLRIDHLFFRTSLSITLIAAGTQYAFHFLGKAEDVTRLPIPFTVTNDRHLFIKAIVGLLVLQLSVTIVIEVIKWLSS